ncbi:MAG TPA: hypothetical protein VL967_06565 [Terracidiphilus sp.]|nr:hypothetical protein [Terracidiphilus sp.]
MPRCFWLFALLPAMGWAAKPVSCVSADEAGQHLNKDICISAHVYDVVELPDGTRFLDVCSPETPDAQCRFTIVSRRDDWNEVGELDRFRDADVRVRGIVQSMHGRSGMILSHVRQFYGGPPKFRPNPKLVRGFAGGDERPPVDDPNLKTRSGHRAFMNSLDRETQRKK